MNMLFTASRFGILVILLLSGLVATRGHAADPTTLNTPRSFPEIKTLPDWNRRADAIRLQARMSTGLWPMPEKTPLNARVFDRVDRADYSIEKVSIEVHPGVYLAGNLFRPIGKGRGPYPGILNPHGHWAEGRFVNSETGSVFARCIQFARMGMVAFAYDMSGYNDTIQFSPRTAGGSLEHANFYDGHVLYAQDPVDQLWGISLMGMQTWNNIRALDFLESLEDVDKKRIAVTGASGGGTQTFMLGAVDNRLAVQVPAVMVSHTMQGGCWCENAPGLRVNYSNMEIAAAAAPRPQMLVGATGDWTKDTMTVEGPDVESVYNLFGPSDQFRYARFDFSHNYNQTSREAVYAFMAEQLLNRAPEMLLPEQPYKMEDPKSMRVWPSNQLPDNAKSKEEYKKYLIADAGKKLAGLWPANPAGLENFQALMKPAYQSVLQLAADPQEFTVRIVGSREMADKTRVSDFELARGSTTHSTDVRIYQPRKRTGNVVVLAHPLGMNNSADHSGETVGFASELLAAGNTVVLYDGFLTGSKSDPETEKLRDPYTNFFTTYNRTDLQEHVGDLVGVCAFIRTHLPKSKIILCGQDEAGLRCLLAAPGADAVIADVRQFAVDDDPLWTGRARIIPAIRRIGGVNGPLLLAAPNPVFIHNTGNAFTTTTLRDVYRNLGAPTALEVSDNVASDLELVNWINAL